MTLYLTVLGFVLLLALGITYLRYREDIRIWRAERKLAKGVNAPQIDEDWEAHEFGDEGRH